MVIKEEGPNIPAPVRFTKTARLIPASRFQSGKTSAAYAKATIDMGKQRG